MITYKKRYFPENLNKDEIILDIETTGLDPLRDNLVLLGFIVFEGEKSYIIQYFAEDNFEEVRLLKIYLKMTADKTIITYNGDKFDIPFLNIRLDKYGLEPIFPATKDIYKTISSHRKYFTFESMRLMDMEKHIGIFRNDPSRYKVISKLTEDIKKRDKPRPIMIHNENDLIATEKLANINDYFTRELSTNLDGYIINLKSVCINNDICQIILESTRTLTESYFSSINYELRTSSNTIEINIRILYGRFDEKNTGFVTLNTFNLENESLMTVDPNLLIIRENYLYNYKNILNLSKKIIENHL
ncbi:ribonuclease H-like domain-containing protein [Anaerococcus sp. Marseille-Q5996]|uniref:ribonuclease H-like domain-containing protein n=1 Tax=Anaerococcus sp. Marseille-Q5996 TaxID=2972769 RepID=UPI0021C9147E|nr:ribonuclease H-like domain-containing protein [Anaerococcus sp. Marseille-Q5996]